MMKKKAMIIIRVFYSIIGAVMLSQLLYAYHLQYPCYKLQRKQLEELVRWLALKQVRSPHDKDQVLGKTETRDACAFPFLGRTEAS